MKFYKELLNPIKRYIKKTDYGLLVLLFSVISFILLVAWVVGEYSLDELMKIIILTLLFHLFNSKLREVKIEYYNKGKKKYKR